MDGSEVLAWITACGSGLWLCIKTAQAYSRSVKSESLGLGSGHEHLRKKKKNLLGGSDVDQV